MGILDFIFGRKNSYAERKKKREQNPDFQLVRSPAGIGVPKLFADNWSMIEENRLPYISIKATPGSPNDTAKSSFGYFPKMPKEFDYPKDGNGVYMYPLAQINFSEVPHLTGYPESGYLQFYISVSDDIYGLNFKDNRDQANFRVLFFEDKELTDPKTDFSFLWNVMEKNESPVNMAHSLSFSLKDDYVSVTDVRYESNPNNSIRQLINKYSEHEEQIEEVLYETFSSNGHKIGGYAYFTQTDPRGGETEQYLLLLQVDSDDEIMWGDVGVANFFIDPADLKNKDFSRVLYNWDCS